MAALVDLVSAGLIERDRGGEVLWTWSYPTVTSKQRKLLTRKSPLSSEQFNPEKFVDFLYSQFEKQWYYIHTVDCASSVIPQASHFSLILVAKDFNPGKYQTLSKILGQLYSRTGNPAAMLSNYLSVLTKGTCNGEENGMFATSDFDPRKAYAECDIKDVIQMFQIEIILIYTALLLKRRLVVYHPNPQQLIAICRALPALVWHRQNWAIVHPYLSLDQTELAEIKPLSSYVAGFCDAAVEQRSDLYDIFVNASSREIVVSSSAKESFAMGKLHKDLATAILQAGQSPDNSTQHCIKEIAQKTKELLTNLSSLAEQDENGKPVVTLQALRKKKMAPATENFLLALAAAEGMVKM